MRLKLLIWLGLAVVLIGAIWASAGPTRDRSPGTRAVARATAALLERFIEEQRAVVRELAQRFGQWESLPAAALATALRITAHRHPALRQLLVADQAGRLVTGYDTEQAPGAERMPAGSLDPILARREVLRRPVAVMVQPRTRAGQIERLELAAVIRRPDTSRYGYVGASVDLGVLRRQLRDIVHRSGLRLAVRDARGRLLYPCRGEAKPGETRHASGFIVTVWPAGRSFPWRRLAATLIALLGLLCAALFLSRLDSKAQLGN